MRWLDKLKFRGGAPPDYTSTFSAFLVAILRRNGNKFVFERNELELNGWGLDWKIEDGRIVVYAHSPAAIEQMQADGTMPLPSPELFRV